MPRQIKLTPSTHVLRIAVFSNENNHKLGDKALGGNNQEYIIQELKSACSEYTVKADVFPLTAKSLKEGLNADYAIVRCATQECCDNLIALHKQSPLKSIFVIGAGVNDFVALTRKNPILKEIPIIRNDNQDIAEDMADFVLTYALMAYRDVGYYSDAKASKKYAPLELSKKSDFPVGIMGGGNLGGAVAEKLTANGFNVSIWKRTLGKAAGLKCLYGKEQLPEFLSKANILINLLPLTKETSGILKKDLFAQLPNKSIVMNLARGEHQNMQDIIEALNKGKLSLAVLDVIDEEPIPQHHAAWDNPKIILTQHTAAKTRIDRACRNHIEKILAFQQGEKISARVDLEQGY